MIGAVLGWKFNHASGICTVGDEITAWPEHLGPVPSAIDIAAWTAEYSQRLTVLKEISALEAAVTPRRVREAVLGDNGWLAGVNSQIAALRGSL